MEWWCQIGRQQMGPYSLAEVQTMIRMGQLTRQTFVRQGLTGTWQPAGNVPGFFSGSPQPGGPPPEPQPQYPPGPQGYPQGGGYPPQGGPQQPQGYGPAAAPPTVIITQGGGAGEGLVWGLVAGLGLLVIAAVAFVFMYISDEQRDFLANRNPSRTPADTRGNARGGTPARQPAEPSPRRSRPPADSDDAPNTEPDDVPDDGREAALEDARFVEDIADDTQIEQSVGMVVFGLRKTANSGQVIEMTRGNGTGFAISPDGYFATNKHVIEGYQDWRTKPADPDRKKFEQTLGTGWDPKLWIFLGTTGYEAKLVHVSTRHDFAVLKIDRKPGYHFRMGTESPKRGTKLYAFGFPGSANISTSDEDQAAQALRTQNALDALKEGKAGLRIADHYPTRQFSFIQTEGNVSKVFPDESGAVWIIHTAPINPGNSGGPLVDEQGNVVGVNTQFAKNSNLSMYSIAIPQLITEIKHAFPKHRWPF